MSRTRSNFLLGVAALGGLTLSIDPAAAQSVQDQTLHVEASVGELCTVTAASLNFGQYKGITITESGSIEIDCVTATPFEVGLDGGQSGGNGDGNREMKNGSSVLHYTLYSDPGFGLPWGTDDLVEGAAVVPVYGRINSTSNPFGGLVNGVYSDEVTITLNF